LVVRLRKSQLRRLQKLSNQKLFILSLSDVCRIEKDTGKNIKIIKVAS
jgi:hypothetical protein